MFFVFALQVTWQFPPLFLLSFRVCADICFVCFVAGRVCRLCRSQTALVFHFSFAMTATMTWSNEKVLRLIAEYEARPVLWDPKDRNFKNKMKKILAWEEIASMLNSTRLQVEHKFRILLVQYRREKSKIMKMVAAGHDLDGLEASGWYAYRSFNFLQARARNNHDSEHLDIDNSNNFNDVEYEEIKTEATSDEYDAISNDNYIDDFLGSTAEEIPNRKRRITQKEPVSVPRIVPKADTLTDIDIFVSYIGSEMKSLRQPQIRRKLKRNILKAVLEACEEDDTMQ